MTCKDCFHYEMCLPRVAVGGDKTCQFFKDKSKVIELPWKVGDTVYYLEYEDDVAVDYSSCIFIMANNDFVFLSPTINGVSNPNVICDDFYERSLAYNDNCGIIVPVSEIFTTKEEAEARLKELQND